MCEKPLTPWIIAEVGGKIIAGHCNCMAGLGESCSHVVAMLWAIESGIRLRESVTQKKAYWVIPNNIKEVPYAPVKKIKVTVLIVLHPLHLEVVRHHLHVVHLVHENQHP